VAGSDNTDAGGLVDALGWAGIARAGSVTIRAGGNKRAPRRRRPRSGAGRVSVVARRPIGALRPVARHSAGHCRMDWPAASSACEADVVIRRCRPAADRSLRPSHGDTPPCSWMCSPPAADAAGHGRGAAGCRAVPGREPPLAQAARQFVLFTVPRRYRRWAALTHGVAT
jgi:shikimate 5-dehydrogenase